MIFRSLRKTTNWLSEGDRPTIVKVEIFLHRGIAARQFQRSFVLAEGIEVKGAWLDNGLLHIDLAKPQPEVRVKTIPITRNSAGTALRPNGADMAPVVESKAEQ